MYEYGDSVHIPLVFRYDFDELRAACSVRYASQPCVASTRKTAKPFAIQRASQERRRPQKHYNIRRASAPPWGQGPVSLSRRHIRGDIFQLAFMIDRVMPFLASSKSSSNGRLSYLGSE